MPLPLLLALALQATPAAVAAPPAAEPTDASDIPHGAPTDDYGFTAWCRGALSGHMELYPAVKAEMQKVEQEKAAREDARYTTDAEREAAVKRRTKEALDDTRLDEEQLAAGRTYLKLYSDAISAAEAASAENLRVRGEAAQDAGFRIWSAARGAEPRTKMWSWVMWELPARCETAARRLLDRSSLLAGALKPQAIAARPAVAAPAAPEAEPAVAATEKAIVAEDKPAAPEEKSSGPEEKPTITESKLEGVKGAEGPAKPPAADAPATDTPPADAKPAGSAAVPEAAKAPAADAPDADAPVIRRRSATPSDAPDAPHPDPKP